MSTLMKSQSMNEDFPLTFTEEEDGSWTVEWDENHPVTSIFNTWTEQDFLDAITEQCKIVLGEEECDRIDKEYKAAE